MPAAYSSLLAPRFVQVNFALGQQAVDFEWRFVRLVRWAVGFLEPAIRLVEISVGPSPLAACFE